MVRAMSRLMAAGTAAGQDSRAAGQAVWRASPPLVAAIRRRMAEESKSADQHRKLTGSPLAQFLMLTGRPQTRLGFWFFTIPPNQRAGIQMIGWYFFSAAALPTQALHRRTWRSHGCRRRHASARQCRCEAGGLIEPRGGAYPLSSFPRNQQAASFRRAEFSSQGYRHIPGSEHQSDSKSKLWSSTAHVDDLNLVFDLLIYTAPKDRSRAIDRYARAARLAPETDEALVLEAMRRARFSIISSVRRHTVAGLIVKDLFRGFEFWLVDEGLESSLPDDAVLATRVYTLEGFAMTAGVLVPLDIELIEYAIADTPHLLRKGQEEAINDRRFAESVLWCRRCERNYGAGHLPRHDCRSRLTLE